MSAMNDDVFEQQEREERVERLKRLLVGGAVLTAGGGAVAGAIALKGDDDLAFPDEADGDAIDKAIERTEREADAPAHDPAPLTQPVAAVQPAVHETAGTGQVHEVVGTVIEEQPKAGDGDGATASPDPAGGVTPGGVAPPPGATATPAPETPATPGESPAAGGATGAPGGAAATNQTIPLHIDPATGQITSEGRIVGSVNPAGGKITLDGEQTPLVYDPANGGRVVLPNGETVPLHDGNFGIQVDGDKVHVGELPGAGAAAAGGDATGAGLPGADGTPVAPVADGAGAPGAEAPGAGAIPGAIPGAEPGAAPNSVIPPGQPQGGTHLSSITPVEPGVASGDLDASSVIGAGQPGGPVAVDSGSSPSSAASVIGAGQPGGPSAGDELAFADDGPPPPPAGTSSHDGPPPAPPSGEAPPAPPAAPDAAPPAHVAGDDGPPPPPAGSSSDDGPAPPPAGTSSDDGPPPPPPSGEAPPAPPAPAPEPAPEPVHYEAPPLPPTPPPADPPAPPAPDPVVHEAPPSDAAGDPSGF